MQMPVYTGPITKIVNRAPFPIEYTYDGRRNVLAPGDNYVTDDHIKFAVEQNVLPGSGDPLNPAKYESLVGIPGRTNCEPFDADYLDAVFATNPERLNRSLLPGRRSQEAVKVQPSAGIPRGRAGIEAPTSGIIDPGKFGAD